ncbi:hypothetical protein M5K25_009281 [Dendrobium thyrsiflorum]|uniref:Uncharacterized protein n=1 Tax=Dendrobium thyrsiflorum TaxID=117978 RepID=A0ABD0V4L8_DENTH
MDPIKIPWFRCPGPSWSRVYLVRGGSRSYLTEGSLSATMVASSKEFDAIGELTGSSHNRNLVRAPIITVYLRCHLAAKPPVRGHVSCPYWQEIV